MTVVDHLDVDDTGPAAHGYLHRGEELAGFDGAHRVLEFAEKPAREIAEGYLASG